MISPSRSFPRPEPSLLGRGLEPIPGVLWTLFIFWSGFMAIIWQTGIGDFELSEHVSNPELLAALRRLLSAGDEIWLLLAATNVYLSLASADGVRTMRRRTAVTLAAAWGVSACSAWLHLPLGPIRYTDRLGIFLGPVSLGAPLLWLALVHGARSAALRFAPRASHGRIAIATALLVLASDFNLEPVAWKLRVWWIWYPAQLRSPYFPPACNYLVWLVTSGLLAFSFREREAARIGRPPSLHPLIVFAILNGMFLLGHLRM